MDISQDASPSARQLDAMFSRAPIGMDVLSLDGRWLAVNDAMLELVGLDREAFLRERAQDRTHPDDADAERRLFVELLKGRRSNYRHEKRLRVGAGGEYKWIHATVVIVRDDDGRPDSVLCMIEDIHERKAAEALLRQQALFDPLTGLGNRLHLRNETRRLADAGSRVGLVLVDVDGLKDVNDTHGHAAGDTTLRVVAAALQAAAGYDGVPIRLGGDEFVLLLGGLPPGAEGDERVAGTAEKVRVALGLRDTPWGKVTASTGVAASSGGPADLAVLLREADSAMYRAKRSVLRPPRQRTGEAAVRQDGRAGS